MPAPSSAAHLGRDSTAFFGSDEMTQAKHTPEQWRIKLAITGPAKSKLEETGIIGTQAKDAIVKVLNLDFEDAKLISAAPELLQAVRSIAAITTCADQDPEAMCAEIQGICRVALAKVTGGAA